jgi:GTP pyrophosphokinase
MSSKLDLSGIPVHLQKELRAKLVSLNIKLTLAIEQLKAEADVGRKASLRDEVSRLKQEAHDLVALYRAGGPPEAREARAQPDGYLVFGEYDEPAVAAAPAAAAIDARATQPLALDELEIIFEPEVLAQPAAPRWVPVADETGGYADDEYDLTLTFGTNDVEMPRQSATPGGRVGEALAFAAECAGSGRADGVPRSLGRVLETVAMSIEAGADEEEVVAAAVHDTVSGPADEVTMYELRDRFGEGVAGLVAECAALRRIDPWEQRDRSYMILLAESSPAAVRIAVRARMCGVEALARQWRTGSVGMDAKGLERLFWSLKALGKAYRQAGVGPLADAWDRAVSALEAAAG